MRAMNFVLPGISQRICGQDTTCVSSDTQVVSPPIRRLIRCPVFVLSGNINMQAESYMEHTMLCMPQRLLRLQVGAQHFLNADDRKTWAEEYECTEV